MRRRSSTTAKEFLPPVEKRCEATKMNVPKSSIASFADKVDSRQTLADVCINSTKVKRPSSC